MFPSDVRARHGNMVGLVERMLDPSVGYKHDIVIGGGAK